MYGLNPNIIYDTALRVYSDLELNCCDAANLIHYQLTDKDILKSFGVNSSKEIRPLIKEHGGLYEALDFVLTSVGYANHSHKAGDIVFIENSCGICIKPKLYITRGDKGAYLTVQDNIKGWTWA